MNAHDFDTTLADQLMQEAAWFTGEPLSEVQMGRKVTPYTARGVVAMVLEEEGWERRQVAHAFICASTTIQNLVIRARRATDKPGNMLDLLEALRETAKEMRGANR